MHKEQLNLLEVCTTLVLLGVGIFIALQANALPLFGPRSLSPGLFPLLSGIAIIVCALTLLALQLRIYLRNKELRLPRKGTTERGVVVPTVLVFCYVLLLPTCHFVPLTIVFLAVFITLLKRSFHWKTLLISGVTVLSIYYLFSHVLMISMP